MPEPKQTRVPGEPIGNPPGLKSKLPFTKYDVEYGDTINWAYTTRIGSEGVSFPTTQPYTPNNTYADSLSGIDAERLKLLKDQI